MHTWRLQFHSMTFKSCRSLITDLDFELYCQFLKCSSGEN